MYDVFKRGILLYLSIRSLLDFFDKIEHIDIEKVNRMIIELDSLSHKNVNELAKNINNPLFNLQNMFLVLCQTVGNERTRVKVILNINIDLIRNVEKREKPRKKAL